MRITQYILIAIATLTIISCGSAAKLISTETTTEVQRDSITKVTTEVKKDTVTVEADSLKISVPLKNLTEKPIVKKSKSGRTRASVRKTTEGKIEVECFTEKYEAIIESQNKIIKTLLTITEQQKTTNTVQVTKAAWYTKALAFVGSAALLLIAALIGKKFI